MLVFKWDPKLVSSAGKRAQKSAADVDLGTVSKKPILMHTFKGHSRTVTSMRPVRDTPSSFVSASLDGSLRIWCLDKFIQLYTFQTE